MRGTLIREGPAPHQCVAATATDELVALVESSMLERDDAASGRDLLSRDATTQSYVVVSPTKTGAGKTVSSMPFGHGRAVRRLEDADAPTRPR